MTDVASSQVPLQATARRPAAKQQQHSYPDDDSDSGAPPVSMNTHGGGQSSSSGGGHASSASRSPLDFVEWGPPPDMRQRELIFDSLNKIVGAGPGGGAGFGQGSSSRSKSMQQSNSGASAPGSGKGDSRGTYVFTWGAGYHGQLGRKFVRGQKKYSAIPMLVDLGGAVVRQVSCGGLHTAVVSEDGKVYTCGDGRKGELGHVHDPSLKQTPRLVEMLEHVFISSVACGGSHTVATTDSGFLYSWGWGRAGQLGHADRSNQKFPKKIDHPLVRDVVAVACGHRHTLLITRSGAALAMGSNRHGQLGTGDFEDRLEATPVRLPAFEHAAAAAVTSTAGTGASAQPLLAAAVACGAIHSCVVTRGGDVYFAGFGEYLATTTTTNEDGSSSNNVDTTTGGNGAGAGGADGSGSGTDNTQHFFPEPRRVAMPEPIRSVSCGQAHTIALSVSNNVYTFGSGEYGQLGNGAKGNSATPRLVLDTGNVRQVAAGRYHSFALTDAGILYGFGCGENGQVGLNSDENLLLPTVVTPILGTVVGQVSCGEHHTAILTSAPWTRLAADVHEWLHAAKVEHELKERYLRRTRRGLTTKDLAKLAVEKERWRVANAQRKHELEAEEKNYMANESDSVLFEAQLQKDVRAALAKAEKERVGKDGAAATQQQQQQQQGHGHTSSQKKLHLPALSSVAAAAEAELLLDEEEKTGTRFPTLSASESKKKVLASSSSGAATERAPHASGGGGAAMLAQTAPLDGLATMRAPSYSLTARAPAASAAAAAAFSHTLGAQPPSRTQFLKESAHMLRRMTAVVHDKGSEQGARELHDSLTHVHGLRKEYDARVNESRRLARRYADVKREFDVSQSGTSSAMDGAEVLGARLSTLQMQFNTVMIKLSESSENRRNYELNIAHLKEESLEHSNELKALRKQHADTNLYMKRIEVLRGAAHAERAKSEGELRAFRSEVASYQRFVAEQMAQFQSIVAIVRAQNAARSLARERREKGEEEAVGMRVALLQGETLASAKESAVLATRLQSLELKLRHFEDSFQKISACTGLNHPDAIVNKFFFKADIRAQLQSDIDDKQQKLQQLAAQEGQLRQALEQARLGLREQTWRDVEVLSENAREVSTRTSKAQKEIERVTQRLAFVQEGLLDLLRTATVEAQTAAAAASAADSAASAAASAPSPPVDEHALLAMDGADQMQTVGGVKGLWSSHQSSLVFDRLSSSLDALLGALSREEEQRNLLEASAMHRRGGGADKQADGTRVDRRAAGGGSRQIFGFDLRHLRMLSQQNQLVEQQLQQQQQQQQPQQQQPAAAFDPDETKEGPE